MTMYADGIYAEAAARTGKTEAQLRCLGLKVFASMLYHAMRRPGLVVWTVIRIKERGHLDVEVDIAPRQVRREKTPTIHPGRRAKRRL